MKSTLSTLVFSILLFLLAFPAYGCGPFIYTPDEYLMYRLPKSVDEPEDSETNCLLWLEQTSPTISTQDIYQAVYKYTLPQVEEVHNLVKTEDSKSDLMKNSFVAYLVHERDQEAADFLLLAKQCETLRFAQNDPWYYPATNNPEVKQLNDIAQRAIQYDKKRFRDRYALQAIRALFSTEQYNRCLHYWDSISPLMDSKLLHNLAEDYIAGIYLNRGEIKKAEQIYIRLNNMAGVAYCQQHQDRSRIEKLQFTFDHIPNYPYLKQELNFLFRNYELYGNDLQTLSQLQHITLQCAQSGKSHDSDMWYYSAAFASHLMGNNAEALRILQKAENASGTAEMKKYIKIFHIFLETKLLPFNNNYERKLLANLQWLDQEVVKELRLHQKDIESDLYLFAWETKYNHSRYYPYDMMRRIILVEAVPRYLQQGNTTRALQLANVASNRPYRLFPQVADTMRTSTTKSNEIDFSNDFFNLTDTLSAQQIVEYAQRLQHPRDEFDRFTQARSYTNRDYLNDIIGTKFLRETNYPKAVEYLKEVPSEYQYRLNTYKCGYMHYSPFEYHFGHLVGIPDYKYEFARQMTSLEEGIEHTSDLNRRGRLLVLYARGMHNSVNHCWALTGYGKSWNHEDTNSQEIIARAKQLKEQGLALVTNPEIKAQLLWECGYANIYLLKEFPKTATAQYIRTHCDTANDYKRKK